MRHIKSKDKIKELMIMWNLADIFNALDIKIDSKINMDYVIEASIRGINEE